MKGNESVIERLNARLSDELAATNQYVLHAEICENWGYGKLHGTIMKRAVVEMKHAEKLIERILFLEGRPIVSKLGQIRIGSKVEDMHQNDRDSEVQAIKDYNADIEHARSVGDGGTRELLEANLKDEENHLDWIEAQIDQIGHMGIGTYLSQQRD